MPGKLDVGAPVGNIGAARISQSTSYCDGIEFRMGGTAIERPVTGNPHLSGSPDNTSWAIGWLEADGAAGGALPLANGPACAIDRAQVISA